jgi:hypothetical protein
MNLGSSPGGEGEHEVTIMMVMQVLWTPWIIRFVAERGYTAMLSVFEDTSYSMSVNHLEKGVNYARKYNATHRVVPSYNESFFRMPPASVPPPLSPLSLSVMSIATTSLRLCVCVCVRVCVCGHRTFWR